MHKGYSFLLLVFLLVPLSATAQSAFAVDAASFRIDGDRERARVDVYAAVPYARLQFLNEGNRFVAHYDLTAELYAPDRRDRPSDLVATQTWTHTAVARTFDRSQRGDAVHATRNELAVEPGNYVLRVRMQDRATNAAYEYEELIEVRDYYRPVALSDVLLLESYDAESNRIAPRVGAPVDPESDELLVFCELYAQVRRPVRLAYEVRRLEGRTRGLRALLPFGRDDPSPPLVAHTEPAPQTPTVGRTARALRIPMAGLDIGEYVVRVRLLDADGTEIDRVEATFETQWNGLRQQMLDLDAMIAQLRYVAKPDDLREIQSAPSLSQKLERFLGFWEKRDLTPGTSRNESMERYYYRVATAARRYGWQSDQGGVFIRFGAPDRVERLRDGRQVREVWHYARLGREVVFLDRSGSGQFVLFGKDAKRFR